MKQEPWEAQPWVKEFDEKFLKKVVPYNEKDETQAFLLNKYLRGEADMVKLFLHEQIEKAKQEGRDEAVEYIDKHFGRLDADGNKVPFSYILEEARSNHRNARA